MMKLIEKTIEIKGKKYQYFDTEVGTKAILFIHGLGTSKNTMPKIFNEFLKEYRCIFLDMPAHNKLPSYNFDSLDDFAQYVVDFIKATHLINFSIAGFSFGGLITLHTQKLLKENGIEVKAVVWGSPLRQDYLTFKSKAFLTIVDNINKKTYKKLPQSNMFQFLVALLGMNITDSELESFKFFENNMLDKFYSLIPTKNLNTEGQQIIYIFGTKDPLIKEDAIKKTHLYGDYQEKYLVKKGAHYLKKSGKEEAHKLIKQFLEK